MLGLGSGRRHRGHERERQRQHQVFIIGYVSISGREPRDALLAAVRRRCSALTRCKFPIVPSHSIVCR